jgi:ABC-2 type transport system ATP-binding protein
VIAPADGSPAAITSVPGLSGLGPVVTRAFDQLPTAPGQTASFASEKLPHSVLIAGQPTVRLTVTARTSQDAVLFAALRDLAPDGEEQLPAQLVAPIRVTGLRPGVPRTVTVRLPAIVRNVEAGHRIVLTVGTTDFGYALPRDARVYRIALPGDAAAVTIPTASGTPINPGHPGVWLIVGAAIFAAIMLAVAAVLIRRRLVLRPVAELAGVPVSIADLVKEYAGGYRAVDDVSFRVEAGQVVGLLGPNGAGKTTVLRVLVGLITPTSGSVHIFGEPVAPGASVLARVGAFIEGPGFLPHLTGRENLRLYWAATGRPEADAEFDLALDIAGLGPSVDRRVRAYSHGMKQRLGIAQAMLGLPELLVLDEPTNGLDPPQIAEMREVLQTYAQTGRTVLVSSHLLAEVEQTCTHIVVLHKGRLIAAGPTVEIAGAGGLQLAVDDPEIAARVLAEAGITSVLVPARRALEDVFLGMIGADE